MAGAGGGLVDERLQTVHVVVVVTHDVGQFDVVGRRHAVDDGFGVLDGREGKHVRPGPPRRGRRRPAGPFRAPTIETEGPIPSYYDGSKRQTGIIDGATDGRAVDRSWAVARGPNPSRLNHTSVNMR